MENDTWYRCTVCGREGRVGRCCGDETREPLNDLAREERREGVKVTLFVAGRDVAREQKLSVVVTGKCLDCGAEWEGRR